LQEASGKQIATFWVGGAFNPCKRPLIQQFV
jgi:hypothetical protein